MSIPLKGTSYIGGPQPRSARTTVWAPPRSLAATYGIDLSFSSSPYLDVSVQAVPSIQLWIHCTVAGVCPAGFPHSEICGSMDICSSPQLIAACHVFRRLSVPRHSPCALCCLTSIGSHCLFSYCLQVTLVKLINLIFLD